MTLSSSQMHKEAKQLLEKYFPVNDHFGQRMLIATKTAGEFIEDARRFLIKFSEEPSNKKPALTEAIKLSDMRPQERETVERWFYISGMEKDWTVICQICNTPLHPMVSPIIHLRLFPDGMAERFPQRILELHREAWLKVKPWHDRAVEEAWEKSQLEERKEFEDEHKRLYDFTDLFTFEEVPQ